MCRQIFASVVAVLSTWTRFGLKDVFLIIVTVYSLRGCWVDNRLYKSHVQYMASHGRTDYRNCRVHRITFLNYTLILYSVFRNIWFEVFCYIFSNFCINYSLSFIWTQSGPHNIFLILVTVYFLRACILHRYRIGLVAELTAGNRAYMAFE